MILWIDNRWLFITLDPAVGQATNSPYNLNDLNDSITGVGEEALE
jgi:hypothetical protein